MEITLVLPTAIQKLPHFKLRRYLKFSAVFQKFYLSLNSSQNSALQNPGGKQWYSQYTSCLFHHGFRLYSGWQKNAIYYFL